MKSSYMSLIFFILVTPFIFGCGNGEEAGLRVGEIAGPCPSVYVNAIPEHDGIPVNEGECIELEVPDFLLKTRDDTFRFTISASGDTGITYTWTYFPDEAGELGGESLGLNILSTSPTCYFQKAEISAPVDLTLQVEVNSTNYGPVIKQKTFHIEPGSNSREYENLQFEWICDKEGMGYFTAPNSPQTLFCANIVDEDKEISAFCILYSNDCLPGRYQKEIEIINLDN